MIKTINQRVGDALFPPVTATPISTVIPAITFSELYLDLLLDRTTAAGAYTRYSIDVEGMPAPHVTFTNLNPSTLTLNGNIVDRVIPNGSGKIQLEYKRVKQNQYLRLRTTNTGSTSSVVNSLRAGSLAAFTWGIIKPLLDAKTDNRLLLNDTGTWNPTTKTGNSIFSTGTWNPNCWAAQFDFSGFAIHSNYWNGTWTGGTLITRRHILLTNHFCPNIGSTYIFMAKDGTKYTRTVLAFNEGVVPNNSGQVGNRLWTQIGDIAIAVLNADLPASIVSYALVPEWRLNQPTSTTYAQQWIGFKTDVHRRVHICGRTDTSASLASKYTGAYAGVTNTYTGKSLTSAISNTTTSLEWGSVAALPPFLSSYSSFYDPQNAAEANSGSPRFIPLSSDTLGVAGLVTYSNGAGWYPEAQIINICIASADARAGISTGYTVTLAANPVA